MCRGTPSRGSGRFDPYSSRPPRDGYGSDYRRSSGSISGGDRDHYQRSGGGGGEEYASDQVKDLLELYIRDPVAFDQYARTYYYGERLEQRSAARGAGGGGSYYDKRAQDG